MPRQMVAVQVARQLIRGDVSFSERVSRFGCGSAPCPVTPSAGHEFSSRDRSLSDSLALEICCSGHPMPAAVPPINLSVF